MTKTTATSDFTMSWISKQTPMEAFNSINDVGTWWSEDFKGNSQVVNDVFEVRFGEVHYSRQQLIEVIPGKRIAWLVTDSHLNFLINKSEWTNTRIVFDIAERKNKTSITFTHLGLTPQIECFDACSGGWQYYLHNSLQKLMASGKGEPNRIKTLN